MSYNQVFATPSFTAPYQFGGVRMRYPIPQDPTAIWYDVTFESSASAYITPVIGASYTSGAPGAQLIVPGQVDWRDGDLVRWTNTYSTVPAARQEQESYQMDYPGFLDTNNNLIRSPFRRTLISTVFYTYICPPTTFTVYLPFAPYIGPTASYVYSQYISDSSSPVTTPTMSSYLSQLAAGIYVLVAETTQQTRWAGNIYQIWTRYVPYQ